MTIEEILAELEGLKDYVNPVGKQKIDGIKAAIVRLNTFVPTPDPAPVTPAAVAPSKPTPAEKKPVAKPKKAKR